VSRCTRTKRRRRRFRHTPHHSSSPRSASLRPPRTSSRSDFEQELLRVGEPSDERGLLAPAVVEVELAAQLLHPVPRQAGEQHRQRGPLLAEALGQVGLGAAPDDDAVLLDELGKLIPGEDVEDLAGREHRGQAR
jgi:hypothetical protein